MKRAAIFLEIFYKSLNRYLTRRSLTEISCGNLLYTERSLSESCQETQDTSFGDLVQRHCIEICWDLAKTLLAEILPGDLLLMEILYRDLVKSRGLASEIICR